MKLFFFVSLMFVVCCWSKPDASYLVSSNYLPPEHEQPNDVTKEATTFVDTGIKKQQLASSSTSISLHQNKSPSAQIESIQPSIHLASFSVKTTVPATETYAQEQRAYEKPAQYQHQQAVQPQTKGSYNYNIPRSSENSFSSASVPTEQTYSYPPVTAISQGYQPSTALHQTYPVISEQNFLQPNFVSQQAYNPPDAVHHSYSASRQQQAANLQQKISAEQSKIPQITNQQSYNTVLKPFQTYFPQAVAQPNIFAPIQEHQTSYPQLVSIEQIPNSYHSAQNPIQNYLAPKLKANVLQTFSSEQKNAHQETSQQASDTVQFPAQSYFAQPIVHQNYAAQTQQQPATLQQTFSMQQTNAHVESNQPLYNTAQIPQQSFLRPTAAQQTYVAPTQQKLATLLQSAKGEQTKTIQVTSQNSLKTVANSPETFLPPTTTQQNYAAEPKQQLTVPLHSAPQTVSAKSTNVPQATNSQFYNLPKTDLSPVAVHHNYIAPPKQQPIEQIHTSNTPPQISYSSSEPNAPVQTIIPQSSVQPMIHSAPSTHNNFQSSYVIPTDRSSFNHNVQTSQLAQQTGLASGKSIPSMPTEISYNYNPSHIIHADPILSPAQISQQTNDYITSSVAPFQKTHITTTPTSQFVIQQPPQSLNNQNLISMKDDSYKYNPSTVSAQYQQQSPTTKQSYSQIPTQNSGSYNTNLQTFAPVFIGTPQHTQVSDIQKNPSSQVLVTSHNYKERPVSHLHAAPGSLISKEIHGSYNYNAPSMTQQEIVANHPTAITASRNVHESQPVQKIELSITSASAPVLTEIRTPTDTEYDQNGGYIYRRH